VRACARPQKQNNSLSSHKKNNPRPSEGQELKRNSRRPRSISHSPLDAIIIIRKTINFKKQQRKKKSKQIKKSYLGNRVPPEFVSVAEPNEELSAMQKNKQKMPYLFVFWWGKCRSNVVVQKFPPNPTTQS
jgi:hypothetical protein